MKAEIFYPYNETFKHYEDPIAGQDRAQRFVDEKNTQLGGHYVLHTKETHDAWWNSVGRKEFEANLALRKREIRGR